MRIRIIVGVVAGVQCACSPAPEQADEEVYSLVLTEAVTRLDLASPIYIHPLTARVDRLEDGTVQAMRDFLAFDTAVIPAVVRRSPDIFRLCEVTPAGACSTPPHRPSVLLSEVVGTGRNGDLVLMMVSDPRRAVRPRRYYEVRVKRGSVVRFEPIE